MATLPVPEVAWDVLDQPFLDSDGGWFTNETLQDKDGVYDNDGVDHVNTNEVADPEVFLPELCSSVIPKKHATKKTTKLINSLAAQVLRTVKSTLNLSNQCCCEAIVAATAATLVAFGSQLGRTPPVLTFRKAARLAQSNILSLNQTSTCLHPSNAFEDEAEVRRVFKEITRILFDLARHVPGLCTAPERRKRGRGMAMAGGRWRARASNARASTNMILIRGPTTKGFFEHVGDIVSHFVRGAPTVEEPPIDEGLGQTQAEHQNEPSPTVETSPPPYRPQGLCFSIATIIPKYHLRFPLTPPPSLSGSKSSSLLQEDQDKRIQLLFQEPPPSYPSASPHGYRRGSIRQVLGVYELSERIKRARERIRRVEISKLSFLGQIKAKAVGIGCVGHKEGRVTEDGEAWTTVTHVGEKRKRGSVEDSEEDGDGVRAASPGNQSSPTVESLSTGADLCGASAVLFSLSSADEMCSSKPHPRRKRSRAISPAKHDRTASGDSGYASSSSYSADNASDPIILKLRAGVTGIPSKELPVLLNRPTDMMRENTPMEDELLAFFNILQQNARFSHEEMNSVNWNPGRLGVGEHNEGKSDDDWDGEDSDEGGDKIDREAIDGEQEGPWVDRRSFRELTAREIDIGGEFGEWEDLLWEA
ncbi:hypothetical protein HK102_012180 [Quaeritorhiza haematococci]|nr:hypothetical protein HK102_012180 [Quaeritorhiza haematococci]